MFRFIFFFAFFAFFSRICHPQVKSANSFWKWTTWTLLQAVPSITFFEDRNEKNSGLRFGLEWQVIPLSYSFNSNPYVSPVQFFYVRPAARFSGSAELFFEPEYVPGGFKYADLKRFMFKGGSRLVLPLAQKGEYLSLSLGTGYYYQKTNSGNKNDGATFEAGVYSFFGMLGIKFNYNLKAPIRYNFGMYIKYY